MKTPKVLLVGVLSLSLITAGCTAAQFFTVLDQLAPAALNILQIVAVFTNKPANTQLSNKIKADVGALETLYRDYKAASAASQPGIKNEINAGFQVLNSDLSAVFAVAQVSDPNTENKITALIGLINTAVQIAEAAIPSNTATVSNIKLDGNDLLTSYNKILTAKTGNPAVDTMTPKLQLHIHSKTVRVLTLGLAK